jgi:hypothetical protein
MDYPMNDAQGPAYTNGTTAVPDAAHDQQWPLETRDWPAVYAAEGETDLEGAWHRLDNPARARVMLQAYEAHEFFSLKALTALAWLYEHQSWYWFNIKSILRKERKDVNVFELSKAVEDFSAFQKQVAAAQASLASAPDDGAAPTRPRAARITARELKCP